MSKRKITSTNTTNDDDKDDTSKDKNDSSNGGGVLKRSRSSRPSAIANIKDEESDDEPAPVCYYTIYASLLLSLYHKRLRYPSQE